MGDATQENDRDLTERDWLTRRLLPGGAEPDPRLTLANERTFLAWVRTALALIGGGVALEAFPIESVQPWLRRTAAIMLVLVGLVAATAAMNRWLRVERAMRTEQPLPVTALAPLVALGVTVAAVVLLVMVVTS